MSWTGLPAVPLLLLWLAASAALVALHLVRRAPTPRVVPLLELFVDDGDGRSLSNRVRRRGHLLALLLSLAIASALVLSLGDPRSHQAGPANAAGAVALVVDVSPSMATRDTGGVSRLELAKRLANELVDEHGDEPITVVSLGRRAVALTPWTRHPSPLRDAIGRLEVGTEEAELTALTDFLDTPAGRPLSTRGGRIIVLSDGTVHADASAGSSPRAPLPDNISLVYRSVGKTAGNLAVRGLSARRYPADPDRSQALLEVVNGGATSARGTLTLRTDGIVALAEPLELTAGQVLQRAYGLDGVQGVVTAEITPEGPSTLAIDASSIDALPGDSRATALLAPRDRTRVLCVTGGDLFLQAALLSDDTLVVDTLAPTAFESAEGYDLVVFDGVVPPQAPAVPALYLRPEAPGPGNPLSVVGELSAPRFEVLRRGHPLLQHVALSDVNIATALKLQPQPSDTIVAADGKAPLLIAGQRQGTPFVALAFRPRDSDLPLRVAWPLLLRNIVDGFVGQPLALQPTVIAGREARVPLPAADPSSPVDRGDRSTPQQDGLKGHPDPIPAVRFTRRGDRTAEAVGWRGRRLLHALPPRPGWYRPEAPDLPAFSARLPDRVQASVVTAAQLTFPGRTVVATAPTMGNGQGATTGKPAPWPGLRGAPWWWLLMAAAALLLTDWWAHRAGFAR